MSLFVAKLSGIKPILREPILHFLSVGLVFFCAYSLMAEPSKDGVVIELSPNTLVQFQQRYLEQNGTLPDQKAIARFRDDWTKEEILFREGLALGFDQDDPVIRHRVVQKMQNFLSEPLSEEQANEPSDSELRAFIEQNADRYAQPSRLSLHVLLLAEGQIPAGMSRDAYASVLVQALKQGANPAQVGLPYQFVDRQTDTQLQVRWDEKFVEELHALALGAWIRMSVGQQYYLVGVARIDSQQLPELEQIRAQVASDWRRAQRLLRRDEQLAQLQQQYTVQ